jgi:hypothetical protein
MFKEFNIFDFHEYSRSFRDSRCPPINQRNSTPNKLFIATILGYIIFLILTQASWVLGGEMWAEMSTNYFINASAPSIFDRLFSTDAGYIPLPQRMIALLGAEMKLSAAITPYYYTWTAIILTSAMVGSFCLRPFRKVVWNDYLRFFASASVLIVADFETRTFINFTYFATFFIAVVTALAFVEREKEIPGWSWFIPFLMLSKPAVLTVIPAMLLVSIVSGRRFRLITLSVIILCLAQGIRMVASHSGGTFAASSDFSIFEKITAAALYSFGFLANFVLGRAFLVSPHIKVASGTLLFLALLYVIYSRKSNSSALIIIGLSILSANFLLNAIALSDTWNINLKILNDIPLYRHNIASFFGSILIIIGLIQEFSIFLTIKMKKHHLIIGPTLFLTWFVISGWIAYFGLNRVPQVPVLLNSQWQPLAAAVDANGPLCVPIDPFGWVYGRSCRLLEKNTDLAHIGGFKNLSAPSELGVIVSALPKDLTSGHLMSVAIVVQPIGEKLSAIGGRVIPPYLTVPISRI